MEKIVRVTSIIFFLLMMGYGIQAQNYVERSIQWIADQDSLWYVNKDFYPTYKTDFPLRLKFIGSSLPSDARYIKVFWGDTDATGPQDINTSLNFQHIYSNPGKYDIQVVYWKNGTDPNVDDAAPDTLHRFAFNKKLEVELHLEGEDGCMEHGVDTFLIHITQKDNPPGTVYNLEINVKNQDIFYGVDSLVKTEYWPNQENPDTICLIFKQPTGIDKAQIKMKMSYEAEEGGEKIEADGERNLPKDIGVYKSPDLREIFRTGGERFIDSIAPSDTVMNFKVCAPGNPDFSYSGTWLKKYQYPRYPTSGNPDYEKRRNFDVKYYYADSVYEAMPESLWTDVTTDTTYVDSTKILFKRAGFYKMRMIAQNQCGLVREGVLEWTFADTLYTDTVKNGNRRRYIQVYENASENLFCETGPRICQNAGDTLVFVDRNRRKSYDPAPRYSFEVLNTDTRVVVDRDRYVYLRPEIYKDGCVVAGNNGCDSTIIRFIFKNEDDYRDQNVGNFRISWSRITENCVDSITRKFDFHVSDVPVIRDTVFKNLFSRTEFIQKTENGQTYLSHCGEFSYQLPDVRGAVDSNNYFVDSLSFYFAKGSYTDSLTWAPHATFAFDSLGDTPNYIRLRAYNGCGSSLADTVMFFTRVVPKPEIWRDSVENNDTLCLGVNYHYHVKGELPANHMDSIYFSKAVYINGGLVEYQPSYDPWSTFSPSTTFRHPATGMVEEHYQVINREDSRCSLEWKDTVYIVGIPATSIYQDSILYCESQLYLDGEKLFDPLVTNRFRKAIWERGTDSIVTYDNQYPVDFAFSQGKTDTLYLTTSNGGGCFVRDTLLFVPQPAPVITLNDEEQICVLQPVSKDVSGYGTGNAGSQGVSLHIYRDSTDSRTLLYSKSDTGEVKRSLALNRTSPDSIYLIYYLENERVDTAFGACNLSDTVLLKVLKPRLQLAVSDSVKKSASYLFTSYRDKRQPEPIDTAYVKNFSWEKEIGGGTLSQTDASDPIWGWTYTYAASDADSLMFVLKAETVCGQEMKDTLIVHLMKTKVFGFTDTICSNTADYLLWGPGKASGRYVDTATLEYHILNTGSKDWGHFTPANASGNGYGGSCVYVPGADVGIQDTVKIQIKGASEDGETDKDTIYLRVNPAPAYVLNMAATDELVTENGGVNVNRIKAFRAEHYTGLAFELLSGDAERPVEDSLHFPGSLQANTNYTTTAKIIMKGLPGCQQKETSEALKFVYPVNVVPSFRKEVLTLCAGDEVALDTLFDYVKGKDAYTREKWALLDGRGNFDVDSTHFTTSNQGVPAKIRLTAYKTYWTYDSLFVGTGDRGDRREMDTMEFVLHVEPSITINPDRDTLCYNQIDIQLEKPGWISVSPARYQDSLRANGQKLNNYTFAKGAGQTDTLIITVEQGNCHRWDGVNASVFVYQMKPLIQGIFSIPDICERGEGAAVVLDDTDPLQLSPEHQGYYWTWQDVNLDTLGKGLNPVCSANGYGRGVGEITLHVKSPKNCPEETLSQTVSIYRLPKMHISNRNLTVCGETDETVSIPYSWSSAVGNKADVEKVVWFVEGKETEGIDTTYAADSKASYKITAEDVEAGSIKIVAAVYSKTPCATVVQYDTVNISFDPYPEVIIPSLPRICQGDTLTGFEYKHTSSIDRQVIYGGGTLDEDGYKPGEYSGEAWMEITVRGKNTCSSETLTVQDIRVDVDPAVRPAWDYQRNQCQYREISFTTTTPAVEYRWDFGDGNKDVQTATAISNLYGSAGDYDVKLEAKYTNGCWRDSVRTLHVEKGPEIILPEFSLHDDTVCGKPGESVEIIPEIMPGNIAAAITVKWYVEGEALPFKTTVQDEIVSYSFTQENIDVEQVSIRAEITYNAAPCIIDSVVNKKITVYLNPLPAFNWPSTLEVCQGGELTGFMVSPVSEVEYIVESGKGIFEAGNYRPGEFAGVVHVKMIAHGAGACNLPEYDGVKEGDITVLPAPRPHMEYSSPQCEKGQIHFHSNTVANQYVWDFGDGNTATTSDTVHYYHTPDLYQAVLTVQYDNQCFRDSVRDIVIHEKPQADFSYPRYPQDPGQVAKDSLVSFIKLQPEQVTCEWVIHTNPVVTGTGDEFTHVFTAATDSVGITLMVETEFGCRDTVSHAVRVVEAPVADFSLDVDPCTGRVVIDNSRSASNHAEEIIWDFSGGPLAQGMPTTSQEFMPEPDTLFYIREYKDTTFTISLMMRNAAGTSRHEETVRLVSLLDADFELLPEKQGCHQMERTIYNLVKGDADTIYIDWGDKTKDVYTGKLIQYMSHYYQNDSSAVLTYPITFTAVNRCERPSASGSVEVYPKQVKAAIWVDPASDYCFKSSTGVRFINKSRGFGEAEYKAEWTLAPGVTKLCTSLNDTVVKYPLEEGGTGYETPGMYTVKLKVEDRCNWDTTSVSIRVRGNDSLNFMVEEKIWCSGQGIRFEALQQGPYEFTNFRWNFGDSRRGTGPVAEHIYDHPDAYYVILKADADGCESVSPAHLVTVHQTPSAILTPSDTMGCRPLSLSFQASDGSHLSPGPMISWDFKNGAYSDKARDSVIFEEDGTYAVRLMLTSLEGCIDSAVQHIYVLHTPHVEIGTENNDTLFCTNTGDFTVKLINNSEENCNFEWWRNGERFSIYNEVDPIDFHNFYGPVYFKLVGIYEGLGHCAAADSITVVGSKKVVADFKLDSQPNICYETPVSFLNQSENATEYKWDLGDGTISRSENIDAHVYHEIGAHIVRLEVKNADGCKDIKDSSMVIYPLPEACFMAEKDNSVIGNYPDSLNLPKIENGGVRFYNCSYVSPEDWGNVLYYQWNFGDSTDLSREKEPQHRFANNGLYEVHLKVQTEYGCTDHDSTLVHISAVKGLYIPNAFAPATGEEGVSRFQPKGIGLYSYKIQVYDKWGTCVWSSEALKDGQPAEFWDGTFNGADLPKGTYLWKASAVFIDGSVWDNKGGKTEGSVILIR